jgi:hypothetical protein
MPQSFLIDTAAFLGFFQPMATEPTRHFWRTHLYIVAIALLVHSSSAGQPTRELLNSDRIAAAFGSYGVEVLEQDAEVRVSNLFSIAAEGKICRTFAIVRYASLLDPAVSAEHAEIVAGGSIGAVFAARGWEVRKSHLSYSERPATPKLASLMRIAAGTPLAEHAYVLDVIKDGRSVEYAALVEIHHPDYLTQDDIVNIYGAVDESRTELAAKLRATATDRSR